MAFILTVVLAPIRVQGDGPEPTQCAGTNGCSSKPLSVLKTEVPTNANTFVASDVYTIVLTEAQKALVGRGEFSSDSSAMLTSAGCTRVEVALHPLATCWLPHSQAAHRPALLSSVWKASRRGSHCRLEGSSPAPLLPLTRIPCAAHCVHVCRPS